MLAILLVANWAMAHSAEVWLKIQGTGTDVIAHFSIQTKDLAAMSGSFAVGFGEAR